MIIYLFSILVEIQRFRIDYCNIILRQFPNFVVVVALVLVDAHLKIKKTSNRFNFQDSEKGNKNGRLFTCSAAILKWNCLGKFNKEKGVLKNCVTSESLSFRNRICTGTCCTRISRNVFSKLEEILFCVCHLLVCYILLAGRSSLISMYMVVCF